MNYTEALGSSVYYSGTIDSTVWEGLVVEDESLFITYMQETVFTRVADANSNFESDLRGLTTTGMATEFVERVLNAVPEPTSWEIGEAFAECTLAEDARREVHWPWNSVRDRRTPRASLPGADLVGFYHEDGTVLLLFGEVKTSSDLNTPPGVMTGGSGMVWQLERNATRLDIQHSLLKWLYSRCGSHPYRGFYQKAVTRYLKSEGKDLLLIGVLIRDTAPNEYDLKARGEALAVALPAPTRVVLIAWYLPVQIVEWPKLLQGKKP